MGRVGGAKYLPAFKLPVDSVFFGHCLDRQDFTGGRIDQRDLLTDVDGISEVLMA